MTVKHPSPSTSNQPRVYLKTLGGTSVQLGGQRLLLPPRGCALIALLAFAEKGKLSKGQASSLIWGGASESSARHSLSQLIHILRRDSPDLLSVTGSDVQLNRSIRSDYESALAKLNARDVAGSLRLISGEFLEDAPAYSSAFENWRSNKQLLLVNRLIAAIHSELGVLWLKGCIEECTTLVENVERRLNHYWAESATATHWHEVLKSTSAGLNSRCRDSHFVGRHFELATLFQKYEMLRAGTGGTVAILGGAGIGKTMLASTFLDGVKQAGGLTVTINSYETDQTSGHRILHQLIESHPFKDYCNLNLANLGEARKSETVTSRAQEQREKTHFLYDKVAQLLGQVCAEASLVIFIDDLHWMDESSVDFVKFLARLTENKQFLLLVALRDQPPKYAASVALVRSQVATILTLLNLQKSELAAFIRQRSTERQSASVTRALWNRTNGHPYLVGEVFRCLPRSEPWTQKGVRSTSPSTVAAYLRSHTQDLEPASQLLMFALATLGKPVSHLLLRKASGLSIPQFTIALGPLFEHELVADANGVLRCNHDLVREMVYGGMSVSQKRSMHRRIAQMLERVNAQPSDILYHYRLARSRRKTYVGALKEAKRNLLLGAGPEADYNYRLAEHVCRGTRKREVIRWRRAQAAAATGLLRIAQALLEGIKVDNPEILRRETPRIELLCLEIDRELSVSPPAFIQQNAQRVRILAAQHADYDTEVNALVIAARGHLLDAADENRVTAIIDEIGSLADRAPHHSESSIGRAWAVGALVLMGRISEAACLLNLLSRQSRFHDHPQFLATYHSSKALYHAFNGELAQSIHCFQSAARLAEEARMWRHRKNVLGNLSGVLIETGSYKAAGLTLAQLVQTAQVDEAIPHLSLAHINYGLLSLAQSDIPAARIHATSGLKLGNKLQRPWTIAYATALLGLVALEEGRLAEARDRRSELLERDGTYFGNDVLPIEKLLVRVAELEGESNWATLRLLQGIGNSRLSTVCRTALKIELARITIKTDPHKAVQFAREARELCRIMGAVRLFDEADAVLARSK